MTRCKVCNCLTRARKYGICTKCQKKLVYCRLCDAHYQKRAPVKCEHLSNLPILTDQI